MIQAKSINSSRNTGATSPSRTSSNTNIPDSASQNSGQTLNSAQQQKIQKAATGGAQITKENMEFPTLAAAAASGKTLVDSKGQSKF